MLLFNSLIILSLGFVPLGGAFTGSNNETTAPRNANHIFNAIYATMRHRASWLYPNGMSFYLATVPRGTQFYHGTGSPNPVSGVEWLAFEPEHALGFAHRSERPPNHHRPGQGQQRKHAPEDLAQQPLELEHGDDSVDALAGYLHTYVTARDLRLLYLDGMSGIKSYSGTLEAQDRILFNDSIGADVVPILENGIGGPPDEQERAILACKMAREIWNDRIDGLIRTEGDFEIILCNFERDLEVVHITRTKPQTDMEEHGKQHKKHPKTKSSNTPPATPKDRHGPKKHKGKPKSKPSGFNDLAGHQVIIDFEHFVTAYTYALDLFPDNSTLPHLAHLSAQQLEPIREDINEMILTRDPSRHAFNWQTVVDKIMAQYADELRMVAQGRFSSLASLREQLKRILEPFIDYRDITDTEGITYRCQEHFIPKDIDDNTLVARAIRHVSYRICSAMTSVLWDDDIDIEVAVQAFQELVSYLAWPEKHMK